MGFKQLTNEVASANVVARTQIAVVALAVRENGKGAVMAISNKSAAAFEGKGARSPRTDTRNMYTTAMSLMGNIILYRITLPHTKDLGFTAFVFTTLEVKVFEHNCID